MGSKADLSIADVRDVRDGKFQGICGATLCKKNGAIAKMVSDGDGGCKCPDVIKRINVTTVASQGEECTASLRTDSEGLRSLKDASKAEVKCGAMICESENKEDVIFMIANANGDCVCPGSDKKPKRAKFCGKGLKCGASGVCESAGTGLKDGECRRDTDCADGAKCIAAPSTGFEIVSGVGRCFDKPAPE